MLYEFNFVCDVLVLTSLNAMVELRRFVINEAEPSENVRTSSDRDRDGNPREYKNVARNMIKKDRLTLEVDFKHVLDHDRELADRIITDYYLQEKTLRRAVNDFVKSLSFAQEANAEVGYA
jgi:hypothetical protein